MNRKHIALLLFLSLAVFIVGCEEQVEEVSIESFIGGTQGISIEFLESSPPSEVFDLESPFDISVKIENLGEWDIDNPADTSVTITGIDPVDFGESLAFLTKDSLVPMKGRHPDPLGGIIQGAIDVVEFPGLQYQEKVIGKVDLNIRAEACYEYGTKVNSKVCILDDLIGITRRSGEQPICNPSGEKGVDNSGGPVHITSLVESVFSKDIIGINFRIQHVGTGSVYQAGTECGTEIAKQNKVYVKVNSGIAGLRCSGISGGTNEGYVTLYNGQRDITCTTPQMPAPRGSFEKPINIELRYGYKQHIDKVLSVRHAGG